MVMILITYPIDSHQKHFYSLHSYTLQDLPDF